MSDASINTINFIFKLFYFKFVLYILYLIIALVILFIFLIPILLIFEESGATLYKTTNDKNILVLFLVKYKLIMYNWCNLDSFREGLSSYINFKFYTPVVLIYYASMLVYLTILVGILHIILMTVISLLLDVDLQSMFKDDPDFKIQGSIFLTIVLVLYLLWISIYTAFYTFILQHVKTAFKYNNNINDLLNETVNNTNIFPISKKRDKEELFDDVIYRRFEPILVMQEYYTNLESFQFKDSNERAKYIVLYVILEYVKYVNNIVDNADYRDKVKHYLLNPLDNKDIFNAFILDNYSMKDFIIYKIKPFDYLVNNIFKVDMTTKEKLEIKKEYNRVLNEELLDNLKQTNEHINRIQPYIYSIIVVVIAMIIIYLIVTAIKKPEVMASGLSSFKNMADTLNSVKNIN
jgi:ABC-type multidrug transport system fused ATPase/permease subunit